MHDYLDEHQIKSVQVLSKLKEICEREGIRYYLLAGSSLGAVRHHGFIPWDDDIDVGVIYEDWYRLREILIKEIESPYIYMDNMVDSKFPRFMGKILYNGVNCIDLFMLVKWTSNKIIGNIHFQVRRLAVECYKFSINYKSEVKRARTKKARAKYEITLKLRKVIYIVLKPFLGRDEFIKLARWNEKVFANRDVDYYINLYSVYPMEKEMIKKEWLQTTSVVLFEDEYYTTVSDTDAYLTHLYGDYMTPPDEKDKIKYHSEKLI